LLARDQAKLYEELLELRKQKDLEKVFFFLGFKENVSTLLNNLDVFILTSSSEGFSIATIEALACGLPVIATKSGGPEEILQINSFENIVDLNEMALANQVLKIIDELDFDSKKLKSMIDKRFFLSTMIEDYQKIIAIK
jgi:glycosyltransferase involved in cell wall biosynthesis